MAPLSRELSGLILPHEHCGSHLNSAGLTIDDDLEKENFKFAGETLAKIWSDVSIENFPVVAEYVEPEASEIKEETLQTKDAKWFAQHVRSSQYFLQIVKCWDRKCCSQPRSSFFRIIPNRFFPLLIPISQSAEHGLTVPELSDHENHKFPSLFAAQLIQMEEILPRNLRELNVLPYDLFCPSVHSNLVDRCCKICNMYFASNVILKQHLVIHRDQHSRSRQDQVAPPSVPPPIKKGASSPCCSQASAGIDDNHCC